MLTGVRVKPGQDLARPRGGGAARARPASARPRASPARSALDAGSRPLLSAAPRRDGTRKVESGPRFWESMTLASDLGLLCMYEN